MVRQAPLAGDNASFLVLFNATAQDHTPDKDAIASAHANQLDWRHPKDGLVPRRKLRCSQRP